MKIKKSIHVRVITALEKGQKRIRCMESEYEEAYRFGVQDPTNSKRFVTAFNIYEDTRNGFFAYFNEAFKIAARKSWNIKTSAKEA